VKSSGVIVVKIQLSENWKSAYPDAHIGILVMAEVRNPAFDSGLEERKLALQKQIRARFEGKDRKDIEALPASMTYGAYYHQFKKTYHVQGQLESIAFKGRSIPSVSTLVEAMFMAEVKNLLLTAGHDLDILQLPLTVNAANGDERYVTLAGEEKALKAGDMWIGDRAGVISSIIYGPDQRTQINAGTRNVVFTVYAPRGIEVEAVRSHLRDIEANVSLVSPGATVVESGVYGPRETR
jgi:DNA/RNA-binding domain of Phe-tRNA-synthetase-like protein